MSYSTAQPRIMLLYMLHINAATLLFTLTSILVWMVNIVSIASQLDLTEGLLHFIDV